MNEDPNKASRFVRSGKSHLKYGIQAYGPEPDPSHRLFVQLAMVVGAVLFLGVLVWWFGFKGRATESQAQAAVQEAPAVQPEAAKPPPPATRAPSHRR